jgi:hypothetical protein
MRFIKNFLGKKKVYNCLNILWMYSVYYHGLTTSCVFKTTVLLYNRISYRADQGVQILITYEQ